MGHFLISVKTNWCHIFLHSKTRDQIHIQDCIKSIQKTENYNPWHITNPQDIGKKAKKLCKVVGEAFEQNCQCYAFPPRALLEEPPPPPLPLAEGQGFLRTTQREWKMKSGRGGGSPRGMFTERQVC